MSEGILSRLGGGAIRVLMFAYLGGMMISMLLFNYQYARQNGFMDWLVFGEVVPSLKAAVWPYYLVRGVLGTGSPAPRLSDTREGFHSTDIPRYYPVLIDYVRKHGTLSVGWLSQAREQESLQVSSGSSGSMTITTSISLSSKPDGSGPLRRVAVVMNDFDCDGTVDRITLIEPDGTSDSPDPAEVEGCRVLWDHCLAIAFMYGEPFK
jgi:hypothetical protein